MNNLVIIERVIDEKGEYTREVFNFEQMWETDIHFVFKIWDAQGRSIHLLFEKNILLESVFGNLFPPDVQKGDS